MLSVNHLYRSCFKYALLSVVFLCVSCISSYISPSGQISTEQRAVAPFEKVSVATGIDMVLREGQQNVLVESYENILPFIETEVSGNTLFVRLKPHTYIRGNAHMVVYVSAEYFSSVEASGGAEVDITGVLTSQKLQLVASGGSDFDCTENSTLRCNEITLNVSGGGEADLHIVCTKLSVNASGGSEVTLSGEAETASIDLSGGSRIEAFSLLTTTLQAVLSGGSTAEVNVADYIAANLSGGSRLIYKGSPRIDLDSSGGSSIIPAR